jgi:hypothetical protein
MRTTPGKLLSMRSLISVAALGILLATALACNPPNGPSDCATTDAVAGASCWTQVAPPGSGGFPPAPDSNDQPKWKEGLFPLGLTPYVAFNGDLWMTGEYNSWSSPDGFAWTIHDKADWGGRIAAMQVFFKGKMWMYGGQQKPENASWAQTFADNLGFQNDIWSSSDGSDWAKVGVAEWPARQGAAMAVFRDKLWLFGGADHVDHGGGADQYLNDVWNSDDGVHWTQVTAAAPWSARFYPGVIVFNDGLYMLGGDGQADVWRSTNGTEWTHLVDAPWGIRHGSGTAIFDGKMWIYGGYREKSTDVISDVWYSSNGTDWFKQLEAAPWSPRDANETVVFKDKLWIFSGKATGQKPIFQGDIWQMTDVPPGES